MPGVSCIYIETNENELLINSYQCYSFIKKEGNHYYYTIHPTDIIPPKNENAFTEFKKEIMTKTVKMEGGERTEIIPDNKNTRRNKAKKNNKTKKNKNKNKNIHPWLKMTDMDHFRARMSLPIVTSNVAIPLTSEMKEANERYKKKIEESIKNGNYYP